MRNIKVVLKYDGTDYYGWQRQKESSNTIQQVMEDCLTALNKESVKVIGAGRTDSGVHALGQVANFKLRVPIPEHKISRALNSELPPDIRCLQAEEVDPDFHARYDCQGKKYRYRLRNKSIKPVFRRHYVYTIFRSLSIDKMKSVLQLLEGTHDFAAFQASGSDIEDTVRTISSLELFRQGDEYWIEVTGDGFLYNMVRIIVGTLIEIGLGKLEPRQLPRILDKGERTEAGFTAPARGLFLVRVFY